MLVDDDELSQQGGSELDIVEQLTAPPKIEEDHPQQDDIPEKYRGKSAQEIIKMHQEAEKLKIERKQNS